MHIQKLDTSYIHIPEGKTETSVRDVPIHSIIKPLIQQLVSSSHDGYLVSGLKRGGEDNKRGHPFSKRFNNVTKKKLGFIDTRINFHCFRKNFAGAMERAGVPENIAHFINSWLEY